MSRNDLRELGEHLDRGQAGLVVVAASDMGAKVAAAMAKADRVEQKELAADTDEIERDATSDTWAARRRAPHARDRVVHGRCTISPSAGDSLATADSLTPYQHRRHSE